MSAEPIADSYTGPLPGAFVSTNLGEFVVTRVVDGIPHLKPLASYVEQMHRDPETPEGVT